jgi:periplasmic protein TonB
MMIKNKMALAIFSIAVATLSVSCMEDEKKTPEATVPTNTTVETVKDTTTNADGTIKNTTTTTTATTTYGKPNPAKKGGKGKTSIVLNNSTTKADDKMEMDKEGVYSRADVMPSFPGGEKALIKFMEDNLQYPQEALDEGVEGNLKFQFAVDEAGKVYTPILIGEKMGYGFEEEAMRVIKKMPKWNPGSIKGKNVKTRFTLPISFVIN